MSDLLIQNARIVYPASDGFVIDRGWLLARDGFIEAIASGDVPSERLLTVPKGYTSIDARGMTLLPGLLNAHMHLYSLYARGISVGRESRDFLEVLRDLWWRLDRSLLKDACWMSAMFSGMDSLRCGTTSIVDHHASPNFVTGSLSTLSDALVALGVRHVLSYEVTDRNGMQQARDGIEENVRFISEVGQQKGLASGMVGLHASFTVSDVTLQALHELVGSRDVGYHLHVAEGAVDEQDSIGRHGKRVVQRLADAGLLGERSLAVHCIGVDASELGILSRTRTPVVINTMSNMNNGVGLPAMRDMVTSNVKVGIGTDGYSANMFEEFRNTLVSMRHRYAEPSGFWSEIQRSQFEHNADIVSHLTGRTVGRLEKGAVADVILLDYASPTPLTAASAFGHVFFGMSADLVDTVIVDGRIVVRDHHVLGVDRTSLEKESMKIAKAVWKTFDGLT
ncbi:MAG: putative aminohydrolase SsnA [Caldisericota bacterium]|nr:putative aminohydrolase SsnA [Caldisericota bacterium]